MRTAERGRLRRPASFLLMGALAFASGAHAFDDDDDARAAWLAREPKLSEARTLARSLLQHAAAQPSAERFVDAARAHFWLGLQAEEGGVREHRRRQTFSQCRDLAVRAQQLDDKQPGGFYFEAVCRAKVAEIDGVVQSVWQLPRLQVLLAATQERDPHYAFGGIDRFWGAVVGKTPEFILALNGMSLDDGERYFASSRRLAPDFAATRVLHAELLLRRGERAAARKLLATAATLRSDDPEVEAWNRFDRPRAKALLRALDDEGRD